MHQHRPHVCPANFDGFAPVPLSRKFLTGTSFYKYYARKRQITHKTFGFTVVYELKNRWMQNPNADM